MEIGTVIGKVWATQKDAAIDGQKLLVVSVLHSRVQKQESLVVAADVTGAGIGDRVLLCRGHAARSAVGEGNVPVDAAIMGIIDSLDIPG